MKTFILKTSLILFCFFSLAASNAQITIDVPAFTINISDAMQVPDCYTFAIGVENQDPYYSLYVEEPCILSTSYLFPSTIFPNVPIGHTGLYRVHVIVTRMPDRVDYHAYSNWQTKQELETAVDPDPVWVYIN